MKNQSKRIEIAKITKARGLKGQVKVVFSGEDPAILEHPDGLVAGDRDERINLRIVQETQKELICTIQGAEDRTAAEKYVNTPLYLERDKFPETQEEDDFYITDLVGLAVKGIEGEDYGFIKMVDNFGAGDLLLIALPSGKEFYLPFTKQTVETVDLEAKQIHIAPPDGYV